MDNPNLEFDDVALIRAHAQIGRQAETKIDRLVAQCVPLLEASGIGVGNINHQQSLFKAMNRSVLFRGLCDPAISQYPTIVMGVASSSLSIWLETPPANNNKKAISDACEKMLPALRDRNAGWNIPKHPWPDLDFRQDLSHLLAADDQEAAFKGFFEQVLADPAAVNIQTVVEQYIQNARGNAQRQQEVSGT